MDFNSIEMRNLFCDLEKVFSKYNVAATVKITDDEILFTLDKIQSNNKREVHCIIQK